MSIKPEINILWFRNNLRIVDNEALYLATKQSEPFLAIYVNEDEQHRSLGGASKWWLYYALDKLSSEIQAKNGKLLIFNMDLLAAINQIQKYYTVNIIYSMRRFEPSFIKQEVKLTTDLERHNIQLHLCDDYLLNHPQNIQNQKGEYYKVFTRYWQVASKFISNRKLWPSLKVSSNLIEKTKVKDDGLDNLNLLPAGLDWGDKLYHYHKNDLKNTNKLNQFIKNHIENYPETRDFPAVNGTSRLGPLLHFGQVSPYQVVNQVKQAQAMESNLHKGSEAFIRQLGWREFSYYLLYHADDLLKYNFNRKFDNFPWVKSKSLLQKWQKGQTGYPIVDAGMRELWATGYMHNRVRMIVASFLTKDLLIHWKEGEKWFWDTLVDADIANNVAGWQWVQGCGADAAPYFRIFNPVLQGEKFDAQGEYVRKWVPEIAKLNNKYIHQPWEAPLDALRQADIKLGDTYPTPIIDHKNARERALAAYKKLSN